MASSSSADLRSKLAKAKGLGASHHGFSHWWVQRLTALALIPLSVWFVYALLTAMLVYDPYTARAWFGNVLNASMMALMVIMGFFHGKLGAQVVIEDYIKHPLVKYALLLANTFLCFALGAVSLFAVLKLHFGMMG